MTEGIVQPNWDAKLIDAVKSKDLTVVEDVLDQAAPDIKAENALIWAAHLGLEDITRRLARLEEINLNAETKGKCVLEWALDSGHIGCAEILLEAGADGTLVKTPYKKRCPSLFSFSDEEWAEMLIPAIKENNDEAVKNCLEHNIPQDKLQSALLWAAHLGNEGALRQLVKIPHMDMDQKDDKNTHNALSWALTQSHIGCAKILVQAGADYTSLSNEQQKKYRESIRTLRAIQPYQAVNDDIVIKYEGYTVDTGDLTQIFNFKKRTVTERVGESLGAPVSFDQFRANAEDIREAYDWMKKRNKKTPAPFSARPRKLNKRHS
ncbi:MAG: hypothetical protein EP349_05035 [Alphaproteobacteria bacterium]|nr:MAG: hypothetical protein EP349_05035 [Alphaproteobacteria bacterium]